MNEDIKLFEKTLKKFNKIGEKMEDYVRDTIKKLNKLNTLSQKFDETIGLKIHYIVLYLSPQEVCKNSSDTRNSTTL